jgi:hypothetical protein
MQDMLVAQAVELPRGNSWSHMRRNEIQQLCRQAAGDAHLRDLVGGLDFDGHEARLAPFAARLLRGKRLVFQGERILVQNALERIARRFG